MTTPCKNILLVEDSHAEVILFQETLNMLRCKPHIDVLAFGKEVLPFLTSRALSPPNLIILDLSLPDINGKEILQTIKSKPNLSGIPVIVRSGFNAPGVKEDCYSLGADWYCEKMDDINDLEKQVQYIIKVFFKK